MNKSGKIVRFKINGKMVRLVKKIQGHREVWTAKVWIPVSYADGWQEVVGGR